jgi:hypothetical protein
MKEAPMERKSAREVQASLTQITLELVGISDRLARLPGELPDSPRREAMEEGEIPMDVATEVLGAVECTLEDDLRPAVQRLERAAHATDESLRRDFEKRRRP